MQLPGNRPPNEADNADHATTITEPAVLPPEAAQAVSLALARCAIAVLLKSRQTATQEDQPHDLAAPSDH
jgi:hypothetical protein